MANTGMASVPVIPQLRNLHVHRQRQYEHFMRVRQAAGAELEPERMQQDFHKGLTDSVEELQMAIAAAQTLQLIITGQESGKASSAVDLNALLADRPVVTADHLSLAWHRQERDRYLPPRTRVAALVDEHSNPKLWIMASIVNFVVPRGKYQIIDEDPHAVQCKYVQAACCSPERE